MVSSFFPLILFHILSISCLFYSLNTAPHEMQAGALALSKDLARWMAGWAPTVSSCFCFLCLLLTLALLPHTQVRVKYKSSEEDQYPELGKVSLFVIIHCSLSY